MNETAKELKFKGWLASKKKKQQEVADLLQLTLQSVNNKLNGREDFTLAQVRILCKHYKISADEFFIY